MLVSEVNIAIWCTYYLGGGPRPGPWPLTPSEPQEATTGAQPAASSPDFLAQSPELPAWHHPWSPPLLLGARCAHSSSWTCLSSVSHMPGLFYSFPEKPLSPHPNSALSDGPPLCIRPMEPDSLTLWTIALNSDQIFVYHVLDVHTHLPSIRGQEAHAQILTWLRHLSAHITCYCTRPRTDAYRSLIQVFWAKTFEEIAAFGGKHHPSFWLFHWVVHHKAPVLIPQFPPSWYWHDIYFPGFN